MKDHEISVVVLTYHPIEEKLLYTLSSIIEQKNIDLQIVISDDGSEDNRFDFIRVFFEEKGFSDYVMVEGKVNRGTVFNVSAALKESDGKYIKLISPGDALADDNALRQWIDYNIENDYQWSFCDAIYYCGEPEDHNYLRVKAHPQSMRPYLNKSYDQMRWNYTVLDDIALGATMISERELLEKYISRIVGRVVYAEDNVWRMMMFDGIAGGYYPRNLILYEHGLGISTANSSKWDERLRKDWTSANEIMLEGGNFDEFQNRIIRAWKILNTSRLFKLFIPGKLIFSLRHRISPRMTETKL